MRRMVVTLLVCVGCGDNLDPEVDGGDVTDARDIDVAIPACVPGQPAAAPTDGTYCATWEHIDGQADAFARYYDRAEITPTAVRWYSSSSGGQKGFDAAASIGPCLTVGGFTANGGAQQSDPVTLCWSSPDRACADVTWRTPIEVGHWAVRLDACP